jgi:hypothetical protein
MKDFKQLYEVINDNNKNKCEENGGVYYCYRCMTGASITSPAGSYLPIALTLNLNINIKILPQHYL